MITLYSYPSCSTCRKAKKWLTENEIPFEEVHIVEQAPTKEQIRSFKDKSGLELKKFFNTSGLVYRELSLKDRLPELTEEEQLELLSSNGKLLKRPIAVGTSAATVGFSEETYEQTWK